MFNFGGGSTFVNWENSQIHSLSLIAFASFIRLVIKASDSYLIKITVFLLLVKVSDGSLEFIFLFLISCESIMSSEENPSKLSVSSPP